VLGPRRVPGGASGLVLDASSGGACFISRVMRPGRSPPV